MLFRTCFRVLLSCCAPLFMFVSVARGNSPAWWYDSQTGIFGQSGDLGDHAAPVNIGQLKYVATQAKTYLDNRLDALEFSPSEVSAMWEDAFDPYDNPFDSINSGDNWAPATVGELRFFAYGFYRLLQNEPFAYDAARALLHVGVSSNATSVRDGYIMPWSEFYLLAENAAPVNLGQLKAVFSFDLDYNLSYIGQVYAYEDTDTDNDLFNKVMEYLSGQPENGFTSEASALGWPASASVQQAIQASGISGGVTIVLPDRGVFLLNPPTLDLSKM